MSDAPILDLGPALLAKKRAQCEHPRALVDDHAASLTCAECGIELDPWWWLRKMAHDEERWRANIERYQKLEEQARAKYELEQQRLREHHAREVAEVNVLIAEKNRLWNLAVPGDGRPLGQVAKRARKRAIREVDAGMVVLSSGKPREQG